MSTPAKILALCLVFASLLLFGFGGRLLKESLAYSELKQISYAECRKNPPTSGWYRITGCRVDLNNSVEELQNNIPVRAYAPIYAAKDAHQKQTSTFAEVNDSHSMSLLIDAFQQEKFHGKSAYDRWFQEHRAQMIVTKDVEGLVYQGIYRPTVDLNAKFAEVSDTDYSQFMMVAEGWKPEPQRAYTELTIGGACLIVAGRLFLRGRHR